MKNKSLAFIVVLLMALSQFAIGARSKRADIKSNIDKADYIFLEGTYHDAIDNADAYFEIAKRAHELNPADKYIGYVYGKFLTLLSYPELMDSVETGIALMKAYINSNPTDDNNGVFLARVLNQLDRDDEAIDLLGLLYDHTADKSTIGSYYAAALAQSNTTENLHKAIDIMDQLSNFEGSDNNIVAYKMQYYLQLGDSTAVIDEAIKLRRQHPNDTQYMILLADVYKIFNNTDSAKHYYDMAVETDQASGQAYYKRAQFYQSLGDTAAYDREVKTAIMQSDIDFEPKLAILNEFVQEFYADSTHSEYIDSLFTNLTNQYPHEEELRSLYGSYLWASGSREAAAEQMRMSLDINPADEDNWLRVAQALFIIGDYPKSEQTLIDATHYFPNNPTFYQLAVSNAIVQKDYDRALSYNEKALEVADSTNTRLMAQILCSKADIYYELGDTAKMLQLYDEAMMWDDTDDNLLNNYAYHLAVLDRDLDRAYDFIVRAVKLQAAEEGKASANTLDTYAWVLFKRKEYAEAYNVMAEILESADPDELSGDVYEHAGDIYFMAGHPDEAVDYWKKALDEDPDNALLRKKVKHKTFFYK